MIQVRTRDAAVEASVKKRPRFVCGNEKGLVMSCESESEAEFHILSNDDGPRDRWRIGEDGTAPRGNLLRRDFCRSADTGSAAMESWFQGITLEFTTPMTPIVLSDYPAVHADREVAASELDRLASLGEIHWYEKDSYPPDLCVCPSHLIAESDKVGEVRD